MISQIKKFHFVCPHCGRAIPELRRPALTVDLIIELPEASNRIVLIQRKNPPSGWALPGGFVEYGETVEAAAIREAREETSLEVTLRNLFGVYSAPQRDPRGHTVSVVFTAEGRGELQAGDDAGAAAAFADDDLPELAFDHQKILRDYFLNKNKVAV